jgi:hypothetical protein
MTTQPEIKAGQRWIKKANGDRINIIFADEKCVVFHPINSSDTRQMSNTVWFAAEHEKAPEKKTRPITVDDIMKMLAVNPVLFYKGEHNTDWWMLKSPSDLPDHMYNTLFSHNPFAPNAVIKGPQIEVTE